MEEVDERNPREKNQAKRDDLLGQASRIRQQIG